MFIPVGHDRQVVNRLPVITIGLIAINAVIFIATLTLGQPSEERAGKVVGELVMYAREHEDVAFSAEAEDRLRRLPSVVAEIERFGHSIAERRRNSAAAAWEQTSLTEEQREMDRLCAEFVALYDAYWVFKYGFVPRDHKFSPLHYLTSMFLHGGWEHLIFNMLFLWLAGLAIEDLWGRGVFAAFYLLGGVAATLLNTAMMPDSLVPCIGASGAIAGLMGAFMVRHFKARIRFFYFYLLLFRPIYGTREIPAYVVLPFWLAQQLLFGTLTSALGVQGGVAFWAHIGGFAFGAVVAVIVYHCGIEQKLIAPRLENKISFGASRAVNEAFEKLDQKDAAAALSLLAAHLREQPGDPKALFALARAYSQTGQRREEIAAYVSLIRAHLKANDRESALEAYSSLLDTYPEGEQPQPLPAREWMALCDYMKGMNWPNDTANEYEKLAAAYPAEPFTARALICAAEIRLTDLQEHDKARELFQRAAALSPAAPALRSRIEKGLAEVGAPQAAAGFRHAR